MLAIERRRDAETVGLLAAASNACVVGRDGYNAMSLALRAYSGGELIAVLEVLADGGSSYGFANEERGVTLLHVGAACVRDEATVDFLMERCPNPQTVSSDRMRVVLWPAKSLGSCRTVFYAD